MYINILTAIDITFEKLFKLNPENTNSIKLSKAKPTLCKQRINEEPKRMPKYTCCFVSIDVFFK